MALLVQIHIANEEPIRGEIEQLPSRSDTLILVQNPRTRDGKDLRQLEQNVIQMILPVSRLNFIQILPSGEEEKVVGFVRE